MKKFLVMVGEGLTLVFVLGAIVAAAYVLHASMNF